VVGPVDNNVFVLRCRETGDAVLLDAANEHERCSSCAAASACAGARDPRPLGPHPGRAPTARRRVRGGRHRRGRRCCSTPTTCSSPTEVIEVGRLRLRTIHTPATRPARSASRGRPRCCSAATPSSPAGPGATKFEGGDFPTIIRSIEDQAVHAPARRRRRRAARPRRRHHHRHRAPPPPGVGRPRLVTLTRRQQQAAACAAPCPPTRGPSTPPPCTPPTCRPPPPATATSPPRRGSRHPTSCSARRRPRRPRRRVQAPHRPLAAVARRSGQPGDARYLVLDADDLTRTYAFRLFPDGTGDGVGP
jgi:hypothetical protein